MPMQDRWLLPEGIDEIFPDEAERLEILRRDVIDLFKRWGYRLVIPPLIEFLDSLLVGTGYDLELQTFKLIDQISGRLMGIRADMTPQIARIDARGSNQDWPSRFCYLGTVLNTQSDHLEKSRSPMQVGAELYGHGAYASDVEIIRLMLEMMAIAGISDVHLDLGNVSIYRGLARQAGLDPAQEADLFVILQSKDRCELSNFLCSTRMDSTLSEMLRALIDLNGPLRVISEMKERLSAGGGIVQQALLDLEAIAIQLARLFPLLPINFDLAELRGYHYQTGVVFAAFVPGYGREIARGGRYDKIGGIFGRARHATGFSADLKVLQRLSMSLDSANDGFRIFAPWQDNIDLEDVIRDLRAAGNTVVRELPGQKGSAVDMGCNCELRHEGHEWRVIKLKT